MFQTKLLTQIVGMKGDPIDFQINDFIRFLDGRVIDVKLQTTISQHNNLHYTALILYEEN